MDAGEKIDKFAMVTMKMTGDYKAPVPQNVEYKLMNADIIEPKTFPRGYEFDSPICGFYTGKDVEN